MYTKKDVWNIVHWLEPASWQGIGGRCTPDLETALEQIAPDMIEAGADEEEYEQARQIVEAGIAEFVDGKLVIHWSKCSDGKEGDKS